MVEFWEMRPLSYISPQVVESASEKICDSRIFVSIYVASPSIANDMSRCAAYPMLLGTLFYRYRFLIFANVANC